MHFTLTFGLTIKVTLVLKISKKHIRESSRRNSYPPNFIESHIKSFVNNLYKSEAIAQEVISAKLPLSRSALLQIRNKLEKLCTEKLTSCNLKSVFRPPNRVQSVLPSRNSEFKLPKMLRLGLVYKYEGSCCNVTYYDQMSFLNSEIMNIQAFHV